MPKKLIDIYPPKKFAEDPAEDILLSEHAKQEGKHISYKKIIWVLIPLLPLPFLAFHFVFAQAKITVWPHITEMHVEEQIIVQVGQEHVDLDEKLVPAKLFEKEREATKSFPATGSEVREEKSGGTIRVFNENTSAQTLIAKTRFISEDGKLFRSKERISVPAARGGESGFADVEVEAVESGDSYNIPASNFSLPGLAGSVLYTIVYGKSSAPMQGGATGEVLVVTREDIARAKEKLLEDLKTEAMAVIFEGLPPNIVILQDSIETELLEDKSLVQEGAALNEFSYAASVNVSAIGFSKEDGVLLARHLFDSYLDSSQKLKKDTFQVNYEVEASNIRTGRMLLKTDVSAMQYTDIDLKDLKSRFGGTSKQEIASILGEFPSLEKAEFSLWPFWLQRLPNDSTRLTLDLFL